MKLPKNITIDWDRQQVLIDGEALPFAIAVDPCPSVECEGDLDQPGGHSLGVVMVPLLCETTTVIGSRPDSFVPFVKNEHAESARRLA